MIIIEHTKNGSNRYDTPIIHSFERNVSGERIHTKTLDFKPYFYVLAERVILPDKNIIRVERGYKSLEGEDLQKIVVRHPSQILFLRDKYGKSFEDNVLYDRRFLIDKIDVIPDVPIRKFYFDIETEDESGVPDYKNPNQKILSIALYDSFDKELKVYLLNNGVSDGVYVTTVQNKDYYYQVTSFDSEKELLTAFVNTVDKLNPDYLLGWNSIGMVNQGKFRPGFDIPYLVARCKKMGVWANKLSPINEVFFDKKDRVKIKGRECIELMLMYRLLRLKEMDLSLKKVAQRELGDSKKEIVGTTELWFSNPKKLVEYNVVDVILTHLIDEKLSLSEQAYQMSRISHARAEDVGMEVQLIRCASLFECKKRGVIFPNYYSKRDSYVGGLVNEVLPGVHKNVISLDLESLYPNSIRGFSISPENIVENGGALLPNGVRFKQDSKALLPTLINTFYEKRISFKRLAEKEKDEDLKELYESKSASYKSLLNSIYGVSVYLFGLDVASAITTTSREVIKFVINSIKSDGFTVIYSDTDSIGFKDNASFEESIQIGERMTREINDGFEGFMNGYGLTNIKNEGKHLKIKFETIYSHGFWTNKKKRRFCWIEWKDGERIKPKLEVKGFELKKSGFSMMYKEVQQFVLESICPRVGEALSKEEIDNYLLERMNLINSLEPDFICGDVSVGKLPKQFFESSDDYTNNNPKRRGVLFGLLYLNLQPQTGKRYKLLYVDGVPVGFPNVLELDVQSYSKGESRIKRKAVPVNVIVYEEGKLPDGFVVDIIKYKKLNIINPIDGIYSSLGWSLPFSINKKSVKSRKRGVLASQSLLLWMKNDV